MIEITRFALRGGVDDDDFRAADKRVQSDFSYQQPGLVRRTTARDEEGEWVVIELWRAAADADAARQRGRTDLATRAFEACIDLQSLHVSRYWELDA